MTDADPRAIPYDPTICRACRLPKGYHHMCHAAPPRCYADPSQITQKRVWSGSRRGIVRSAAVL